MRSERKRPASACVLTFSFRNAAALKVGSTVSSKQYSSLFDACLNIVLLNPPPQDPCLAGACRVLWLLVLRVGLNVCVLPFIATRDIQKHVLHTNKKKERRRKKKEKKKKTKPTTNPTHAHMHTHTTHHTCTRLHNRPVLVAQGKKVSTCGALSGIHHRSRHDIGAAGRYNQGQASREKQAT